MIRKKRAAIGGALVWLSLAMPAGAQSTLDAMTGPPPPQRGAPAGAAQPAATPSAQARPVGQAPPVVQSPPAQSGVPRTSAGGEAKDGDALRKLQGGEYPNMQRLGSSVPLNQLQSAWEDPVPAPGQSAPGVLRFVVNGELPGATGQVDPVMQVRVRRFMQSAIHLPCHEQVKEVHVGDSHVFRVSNPTPHEVLISPRYEAADTNLRVVTASGRVYAFYLRAEGVKSRWLPDVEVFLTTDTPKPCTTVSRPGFSDLQGEDYLEELGIDFAALELHSEEFRVFAGSPGDAEIAPRAVASDGRTMLLDFGPRGDTMRWPIVAQRDTDGVDQPVNSRPIGKRGRILQVMAVGDLTLRSGQKVVCIRRRGHAPVPQGVIIDSDLGRRE
jgi:hypothetical protein